MIVVPLNANDSEIHVTNHCHGRLLLQLRTEHYLPPRIFSWSYCTSRSRMISYCAMFSRSCRSQRRPHTKKPLVGLFGMGSLRVIGCVPFYGERSDGRGVSRSSSYNIRGCDIYGLLISTPLNTISDE